MFNQETMQTQHFGMGDQVTRKSLSELKRNRIDSLALKPHRLKQIYFKYLTVTMNNSPLLTIVEQQTTSVMKSMAFY